MTQLSNLSNWIDPNPDENEDSFYPLQVKYWDKEEPEVIASPNDIRQGVAFRALKTNFKA